MWQDVANSPSICLTGRCPDMNSTGIFDKKNRTC